MHPQHPGEPHDDEAGPEPIARWIRILCVSVGCSIAMALGIAVLAAPKASAWAVPLVIAVTVPLFLPAFSRRARNLEERLAARRRASTARRIVPIAAAPYALAYLTYEGAKLAWPGFSLADTGLGRLAQGAGVAFFLATMTALFTFHYYDAKAGSLPQDDAEEPD